MFLLAHLLAGMLLGLVFALISGDRRAVAVGALGAVLPDLIDKPLGLIVLKGIVDAGRIYVHGLLVLMILFAAGMLLWRYRATVLGIVLAVGVLSHQIMDRMWTHPVAWFYPMLGPYPRHAPPDFFWDAIWRELHQPSEWACLIVSASVFLILYRNDLRRVLSRCVLRPSRRILHAIAAMLSYPGGGSRG